MFYPRISSMALILETWIFFPILVGDYFNLSILGDILEFWCFCSNDQELVLNCTLNIKIWCTTSLFFPFKKRGRETSLCGCLSHAPHRGPGPQPRHAPWLGIEPATLWFPGQHSIHWATPARVPPHFSNTKFPCIHSVNSFMFLRLEILCSVLAAFIFVCLF